MNSEKDEIKYTGWMQLSEKEGKARKKGPKLLK